MSVLADLAVLLVLSLVLLLPLAGHGMTLRAPSRDDRRARRLAAQVRRWRLQRGGGGQ